MTNTQLLMRRLTREECVALLDDGTEIERWSTTELRQIIADRLRDGVEINLDDLPQRLFVKEPL